MKSDSESYLLMVNSKTWNYAQADFALATLEFGGGLFILGCTHKTPQVQSSNWPVLSVLDFKASCLTGLWVLSSFWGGLR